jgi:hypothetical protein
VAALDEDLALQSIFYRPLQRFGSDARLGFGRALPIEHGRYWHVARMRLSERGGSVEHPAQDEPSTARRSVEHAQTIAQAALGLQLAEQADPAIEWSNGSIP